MPVRINQGRWVFNCQSCGNDGAATPGLDTVVCTGCSLEHPVAFPDERVEIERILLLRTDPTDRNWVGESLDQLRRENTELGLPA